MYPAGMIGQLKLVHTVEPQTPNVRVQFTLFTMRHSCMTRVTEDYKSQLWLDVLQPK